MEVRRAARAAPPPAEPEGARLLSAEETTALRARTEEVEGEMKPSPRAKDEIDADSVFAKLKSLKSDKS
jgi:hypothetical protein